jgi:hypothetical protein
MTLITLLAILALLLAIAGMAGRPWATYAQGTAVILLAICFIIGSHSEKIL